MCLLKRLQILSSRLSNCCHKADVLDVIKGGQLTDDVAEKLTAAAKEVSAKYVQQ